MITELIAQLTNNTTSFVNIEGAWKMQPFDEANVNAPSLYVSLISEASEQSNTDNFTRQRRTMNYGILLICDGDSLESLRDEIDAALLSWQATEAISSMEHVEGYSQEISGGYIFWQDVYSAQRHVSQS